MSSVSRASQLVELAAEQAGFVTSRQARSYVGTSVQELKRMTDAGALERLHHGIYRLTRLPGDEYLRERLAWVALDPDTVTWERLDQEVPTGVLSHRTAARLHQLGDVDADEVELTATRRIRLSIPDLRIHRGTLTRDDWQSIDGLAVTTVARTISDLAAEALDSGHLAAIVRDGLARDQATTSEVVAALEPFAFDYGHRLLDGQGFLEALITEAGVPATTLEVADIARTHTRSDLLDHVRSVFGADLAPGVLADAHRTMTEIGPPPAVFDEILSPAAQTQLSEALKAIQDTSEVRRGADRVWRETGR